MTTTYTTSQTFTLTHAKYLASKVTADMLRCQQAYGVPSNHDINRYGTELAVLLKDGYVERYEFGFKRDNTRDLCWRYTVVGGDFAATDDRPGGIFPGGSIVGAHFYNRLILSPAWFELSPEQQEAIEATLPIKRTPAPEPADGAGRWQQDRCYSVNGVSLPRSTFRSFS
jgi:hypothetical protein